MGCFVKKHKTLIIFISAVLLFAALIVTIYCTTYNNPIVAGDAEVYAEYNEVCLKYSHTLMSDFLGIPAHAQFIEIRKDAGGFVMVMSSLIPPSRTKVWHSDSDVPYWENGVRSYRN